MSEERILFEIERLLLDKIQVLQLIDNDTATLEFLFNLVSRMATSRLGIPADKNVHKAVEHSDDKNYEQLLENIIRPAMYGLCYPGATGCAYGIHSAVFIYRCLNAAASIALHNSHGLPVHDFCFRVDCCRKARDVVGEWLDL